MKDFKLNSVLGMIVMIVLGVVLVIFPGRSMEVAVRIFGLALLLIGAVTIIGQFLKKGDKEWLMIILGAAEAVVGLIIMASPGFVVALFPILAGIVVVIYGVSDLMAALKIRKLGASWQLSAILAVITIILGVVLICRPTSVVETIVRVIGVVLVYRGVTGAIIQINRSKAEP